MSFPQTYPSQQILSGGSLWRLFTALESSGDIYESDVSASALAIGPQSDLSAVTVSYFDPAQPNKSNTIEVSVNQPFVGRLDAFSSRKYGTGEEGKLLIAPSDYVADATYQPNAFAAGDTILNYSPRIDFLQFFGTAPAVFPGRNDRVFRLNTLAVPAGGNNTVFILMPMAGRRTVIVHAITVGLGPTFSVEGVQLNYTTPGSLHTALVAPAVLGSGTPPVVYRMGIDNDSSGDRQTNFDLLQITLDYGGTGGGGAVDPNFILNVFMSDRAL